MVLGKENLVRGGAGIRRPVGVCVLVAMALLAFAVPFARADTGDIVAPSDPENPTKESGWQAGTCEEEPPESSDFCSIDTPEQFFEQAGGHPQWGFTQIIVKHDETTKQPVGELKTVRVDLPVGLSVNPQATPQCPLAVFEASASNCAALGAKVGESEVTAWVLGLLVDPKPGVTQVPVYNVEPVEGEPARFGFELGGNEIFLRANVAWESDYHEGFTIDVPALPFNSLPLGEGLFGGAVYKNRLVFEGRAGNGTFITTPTTCLGPPVEPFKHVYSTLLRAQGYGAGLEDPNFPNGSSFFESPIPDFTFPKECDSIPFEPSLEVEPNTAKTDSPSGAAVEVDVPFEVPNYLTEEREQASSHVRTATVTLPAGMGLNPSAANGLLACTDAQFGKGTTQPVACPAASQIGTVAVETPPLPEGSLSGNVYLGEQKSRDPASGELYRIFVDVESARYGISARLVGNTSANPQTGQLTTTFAENPQVPFTSFRLQFNGGPRAPLTSPPTCGPNAATSAMVPWSTAQGSVAPGEEGGPNTGPPASPSDEFELANAPGGGACPATLGARPFAPGFAAHPDKAKAGAYSPFEVALSRNDGNQELKGVEVTLPPGLTAKLAGVRYCPESAIAAAAANSGLAEAAAPSCPDSSLVGRATVAAGSGSEPFQITGKAFLSGPYNGAPLSLVIVTPATAGPFDLGSVVVRVALFVDPATAQVRAVSDAIPHVFGGALLDLRSVAVKLDRPKFSLNPTNCSPFAVAANLRGGGANPLNPAAFTSLPASAPFQVNSCDKLDFRPKLFIRTFGGTKRAKRPRLRATLVAREGDANIGRAAVTLPNPLDLEQSNLANVCTRPQFAAHECPRDSVYGFASAETPLLDAPLKGPIYLRSSDNLLPDLVADLRGQVEIALAGRIDTVKGRMRTTYDVVPDVPVSKFVLTLPGGRHGLLVNSGSLCARKYRVIAKFKGQNGKKANQRPKLRAPCHRHRRHQGRSR
jgi:hypothetical protein